MSTPVSGLSHQWPQCCRPAARPRPLWALKHMGKRIGVDVTGDVRDFLCALCTFLRLHELLHIVVYAVIVIAVIIIASRCCLVTPIPELSMCLRIRYYTLSYSSRFQSNMCYTGKSSLGERAAQCAAHVHEIIMK